MAISGVLKVRKFRPKGLRRRWFINTVCVVLALGIVCVLGITAAFAAYYYSGAESDLRHRANTITGLFYSYQNMEENAFFQSCINYVRGFNDSSILELQFIDYQGQLIATSSRQGVLIQPTTSEVLDAINDPGTRAYIGMAPRSASRIIAVSAPVIYSDGTIIGALRYVILTETLDMQILHIFLISFAALMVIVCVVLICSHFYIRSILIPVSEITDKAKMITNGSYGIQIKKHYDDEIGELADTINEMSLQINQNEKMQTEFISSLSHELRTPLTAINGWSETVLNEEDLSDEARRGVKIIHRETKRLTEMVLELLDFTKIQDGRFKLNMVTTDIRSEFEDIVFMYGSRMVQEGISMEYEECDEEIPEITCDPKRLRQVFFNILDNATKHGAEGKKVNASLHCEDDTIVIRIRDYGVGIPEDELPLIKKKFYKGSSKSRGTGIGLAVCDEIVAMHGGTLELTNASGGGTLVTVTLPVTQ